MGQITYTNKVALNENPEIADINKVTDDDMNEIKSVVNDNYNNTIQISNTQPTDSDNKIWIDTSSLSQSDDTNMKYNDNGTYKDIYVKAFDTLPVGTEVDYDGETVPSGWAEVTPTFPILRLKPSNNISITGGKYQALSFDEEIDNTASDYLEQNQAKTHIIAKKKCTIVIAGAFSSSTTSSNGSQFGVTVNWDKNLNQGVKFRSLFLTSGQNSQIVLPATYINLNAGDYMAIPMYFPSNGGITTLSYINVAVVQKW